MTGYVKMDHLGFSINIEFLPWMDSPFSLEYGDESLYVLGFIVSFSIKEFEKYISCHNNYNIYTSKSELLL